MQAAPFMAGSQVVASPQNAVMLSSAATARRVATNDTTQRKQCEAKQKSTIDRASTRRRAPPIVVDVVASSMSQSVASKIISKTTMRFVLLVGLTLALLLAVSFYLGSAAHAQRVSNGSAFPRLRFLQPIVERLPAFALPQSTGVRDSNVPPGFLHIEADAADALLQQQHQRQQQQQQEAAARNVVKALADAQHDAAAHRAIAQQKPDIVDAQHVSQQEDAAVTRIARHLKYWNHASQISRPSLWPAVDAQKYLVFQTWRGGFNNESVLFLARHCATVSQLTRSSRQTHVARAGGRARNHTRPRARAAARL